MSEMGDRVVQATEATEALIMGLRASAASRWPDDIKRQNEWMDQRLKIALGEAADGQ